MIQSISSKVYEVIMGVDPEWTFEEATKIAIRDNSSSEIINDVISRGEFEMFPELFNDIADDMDETTIIDTLTENYLNYLLENLEDYYDLYPENLWHIYGDRG